MQKYFYTDGANNFGPFTLEELRLKNITRETQVWFQGMSNWESAGNVPELNELFKLVPPPREGFNVNYPETRVNQPDYNQPPPRANVNVNYGENAGRRIPPKTWLVESILATLFCCLPLGIVGIVNATSVESKFQAGDIQGATLASENAKKWTVISIVLGIVGGFIAFGIGMLDF